MSCMLCSCGLIPTEEEEHKLQIVTNDAAEEYDLALAELRDVTLSKSLVCTYSQLNELKLYFSIGGYRVSSVYVMEGDQIHAGDILATLDVSMIENEIISLNETILEAELKIAQSEEKIAFYDERINRASTGLRDKEQYTLSKQECEEAIISCTNAIEFAESKIERDEEIIAQSVLYSEIDGTVYYVRDGLQGEYSDTDTIVMKLLDSSECAFTTTDKSALPFLNIGDPVTVGLSTGEMYPSTVTAIDEEKGDFVFELDEPDFSIKVGTRGAINLLIDERTQVLSLPRVAVYGSDGHNYVYVLNDGGVREIAEVEIGLEGNIYTEIKSGLEMYSSVIAR